MKTLRKFFRTKVTNAQCIEDLKYFWMGQPCGVHRPKYYMERLDVAVDEYRQFLPYLTIHKAPVPVEKEELEKRDKETQKLKSEIAGFADLESMVADMARELKELKKGTALWEKAGKRASWDSSQRRKTDKKTLTCDNQKQAKSIY